MLNKIISDDGSIIALINNNIPSTTTFVTDNNCTQQVGYIIHKQDTIIPRHYHQNINRSIVGMVEVLYVVQGKCMISFYDTNQRFIVDTEINVGDLVVILAGGHGFKMLEDTTLLEIKHGPYIGLSERVRF